MGATDLRLSSQVKKFIYLLSHKGLIQFSRYFTINLVYSILFKLSGRGNYQLSDCIMPMQLFISANSLRRSNDSLLANVIENIFKVRVYFRPYYFISHCLSLMWRIQPWIARGLFQVLVNSWFQISIQKSWQSSNKKMGLPVCTYLNSQWFSSGLWIRI